MENLSSDILMITYNRPEYTGKALGKLLSTVNSNTRVWVWHNGNDNETLDIVKSYLRHPNFFRFHHSEKNMKLIEPTNWLWKNAEGELIGKVDDDGVVSDRWIERISDAHSRNPELGIVGSWHFHKEDFDYEISKRKMVSLNGNVNLIENCWVSGNGYLMKRECIESAGYINLDFTFTDFCIKTAVKGWKNGWLYPLVCLESLDDPRSPHTILKNNEMLKKYLPLSAIANGVDTLEKWESQLKRSAIYVQKANVNPNYYIGWRKKINNLSIKMKRIIGIKKQW